MTALDIAKMLGVTITMDWDNEFRFDIPDEVPGRVVERFVMHYRTAIETEFMARARQERAVYVGGPFDGCRNERAGLGGVVRLQVDHRRTAVYRQLEDGRAIFSGMMEA